MSKRSDAVNRSPPVAPPDSFQPSPRGSAAQLEPRPSPLMGERGFVSWSRPRGLRYDDGRGGQRLGPDDLELSLLPLAHHAGRGDVDALGELDGARHGLELGRVQHLLYLLPVEPHLAHATLEDLQRAVGEGARPPVGLLLVLLHMCLVVLAGARMLHLRIPARDPRYALGALEAVAVEGEGGADSGKIDGRIEVHFLGLTRGEDVIRWIGQPQEDVGPGGLEPLEDGREVLDTERIALGVDDLEPGVLQR